MARLVKPKKSPLFGGKTFGARVRAARLTLDLKQADIGERMGQPTRKRAQILLSSYESNGRQPSLADLVALAAALETNPNALLGWGEDEPAKNKKTRKKKHPA